MFGFRELARYRLGLAFLSGLMLAFSFPKWDLFGLAWLAPGLMLVLGAGQPGKKVFLVGFVAGLGRYLVSFYWFLLIPVPAYAFVAWLGVCAYLSLFVGAWCWTCWRLFPQNLVPATSAQARQRGPNEGRLSGWAGLAAWPAFCAAAWVAMEMGFAHVLTGFPWTLLGVSQYKFLPLIQIASVTGIYGVSFLVVWLSVALAFTPGAAARSPRPWRAALGILALPLLSLAAVLLFGWKQLAAPEPAGAELKVALVQPSIPQHLIWAPNEATNRLNQLLALSELALAERPDLLVWPEAALPGTLARTRATQEIVTALVRRHNVWMVLGAEDSGRRRGPDGRRHR